MRNFTFLGVLFIALIVSGCSDSNNRSASSVLSGDEQSNKNPDSDSEVVKDLNKVTSDDKGLKPPALTITAGEETIRATLGTYSWSIEQKDGTEMKIEADSFAVSELVNNQNPLQVTIDTIIELDFEKQPDNYTVRIWDDNNNVISTSDKVVLPGKGEVIYQVLAHWKQDTASYAFSLNVE